MQQQRFDHSSIPDQTGRTAIVTGANSGIGFAAARALAERGADVVLACRSRERGEGAVAGIREALPEAKVRFEPLDLADLASIKAFGARVAGAMPSLDMLVLNAGVMMPGAQKTKDGFELQLGVNHLGHFALAGLLLPSLAAAPRARVVVVSSLAHRLGRIDFDDLHFERRRYVDVLAYGQSKLANLLFAEDLQRRVRLEGLPIEVVAVHPGWSATELQRTTRSVRLLNPLFGMKPAQGALPTLRGATDPSLHGGEYLGPDGFMEMVGYPAKARRSERSRAAYDAKRLWEVSEALTGVPFLSAAGAHREAA